jgi:hypothetical protein
MDAYYMAPSEESLRDAMGKYTQWLDENCRALTNPDNTLTKTKIAYRFDL